MKARWANTQFNNADFYFSGSKISASGRLNFALPMTARCNVNNPLDAKTDPSWNTLIVGYKDPDGQQTNASVVARLIQIKRATGTAATIATFNSNNIPLLDRRESYITFGTALDFHNNEYLVQLDLVRTTTDVATPIAYSVRLTSTSKIPQ